MEETTRIEKILGHPHTTIAATSGATIAAAIAAAKGDQILPLLAPLLPVLTMIPAAKRQTKRIENAIKDIEQDLKDQKDQLQNLTDGQYEFVTASIASVFSTVQQEKIDLLRTAIRNAVTEPIEDYEGQFLARVIRDISPTEAGFLINSIVYRAIQIGGHEDTNNDLLRVRSGSLR